ncbi:hypothetical protein [Enterococcus sp. AZ163]|uniref:hypothetical protein n=1 Tax=Enterococcus sp. AZ163 TaxID=2774638 RepID=UPI003D2D58C0
MSFTTINDFLGFLGNIIGIGGFLYTVIKLVRKKVSTEEVDIERSNNSTTTKWYRKKTTVRKRTTRTTTSSSNEQMIMQLILYTIIFVISFAIYSQTYNLIPTLCAIALIANIIAVGNKKIVSKQAKKALLVEYFSYLIILYFVLEIPVIIQDLLNKVPVINISSWSNFQVWFGSVIDVLKGIPIVEEHSTFPLTFATLTFRIAGSYIFVFLLMNKLWKNTKKGYIDKSFTQSKIASTIQVVLFFVFLNLNEFVKLLTPLKNFICSWFSS